MNTKNLIEKVKTHLDSIGKGHDFTHIERVIENAKQINDVEKQDWNQIELLCLLHDVFDEKFYAGKDFVEELKEYVVDQHLSETEFNQLYSDLKNFGFKGGLNKPNLSQVGQIVSDADRLDAIGAIGIARTMMYGSVLYDNNRPYKPIESIEEYRDKSRPILFHFYDKLLKLKDLMWTKTGKEMAQQRHDFMLVYLNQLARETNIELPQQESERT